MPVNKIEGGKGQNYKADIHDTQYPEGYQIGAIKGEKVVMRDNRQTYTGVEQVDPESPETMNDTPPNAKAEGEAQE